MVRKNKDSANVLQVGGAGGQGRRDAGDEDLEGGKNNKRRKASEEYDDGPTSSIFADAVEPASTTAAVAPATVTTTGPELAKKSDTKPTIPHLLDLEKFSEATKGKITCTKCITTLEKGEDPPTLRFVVLAHCGMASRITLMCSKCGACCGTHEPEVAQQVTSPPQSAISNRDPRNYKINNDLVDAFLKVGNVQLLSMQRIWKRLGWCGNNHKFWGRRYYQPDEDAVTKDNESNRRYANAMSAAVREFLESIDIMDAQALLDANSSDVNGKYIEWREKKGMGTMKGEGAIVTVSTWKGLIRKAKKKQA
jgi:hypothetical protein